MTTRDFLFTILFASYSLSGCTTAGTIVHVNVYVRASDTKLSAGAITESVKKALETRKGAK